MEKRLVEVWMVLAQGQPGLYLVVSNQTYSALLEQPDMKALSKFSEQIIIVQRYPPRFPAMIRALVGISWRLPRGAVVHYLLNAPPLIDRFLGHRMLFSWVSNYTPRLGRSRVQCTTWLAAWSAFHSAHYVDVLNPDVATALRRNPCLASRVGVTAGGSFTNNAHFRPALDKRNDVVFLGRTEPGKNALAFVKAIPLISEKLAKKETTARFLIYGAPASQEAEIVALLASEPYRNITVERGCTDKPASLLAPAKVFVSLQVPSNYPSKALVEAMACGCIPVINASGESHLMADRSLATYIKAEFSIEELASAVVDILLLDREAYDERSRAIRECAIFRFRIEYQIQYYSRLWGLA